MTLKQLNKKEIEELVKLYEKERENFYWLISFEEFIRDYVVKCEVCGEFFVTDMNETVCEECQEEIEFDKLDTGSVELNWDKELYYESKLEKENE